MATVEGVRLRNLRSTPWASLVGSEGQGEETHRALSVEGATTLHEAGAFRGVREWLDRRWSERHSHAPDWAVAFVELKPERVFSHDPRADA